MKPFVVTLAACAALGAASAASADDLVRYTFSPGTTFSFTAAGNNYAIAGGFTYNATSQTISDVTYTASGSDGVFQFTTGTIVSPIDVIFSGDGSGDNNEYFFAQPLGGVGVDPVTGGAYHRRIWTRPPFPHQVLS